MTDKKIVKRENVDEVFLDKYLEDSLAESMESKKNCKLCNSKVRDLVEAKFAETGSYKLAHKVVQDSGENITYASTRRHILRHYSNKEMLLDLGDYANDIRRILSCPKNRINALRERIAMLERRMYAIELATEGESLDEMRKSAETVKKLSDTILSHESEIQNIKYQGEPIKLLVNNLKVIITEELKGATTEVKSSLMNVFNKLIQSTSDIIIEKE